MKLLRFGPKGAEKPGALHSDGSIRDLSGVTDDFAFDAVSLDNIAKLKSLDLDDMPTVEGNPRIGSCVADIPNFHCIGLNYVQHAKETGNPIPKEPVIFTKATSCLNGPYDNVIIPKGSEKTDWEVELGIIIGQDTEHVSVEDALSVVAGYCIVNDVSERAFQAERGGQWCKGKSAPTFGPTGPWLVTTDEVPNPQNLGLSCSIDGAVQQSSNTSDMIFTVAECISYLSQFLRLRTGDLICTGTPEGVGLGQKPPRFLKPGEAMELTIEGLGSQRQEAVAFPG